MDPAETHDRRCPDYVLTRRPARRRQGGLLLVISAMAASSMTGLHGGPHRFPSAEPAPPPPSSGVVELASARLPLLALPFPARPAARPAPSPAPVADRSLARPIGFGATTDDTGIPFTALAAYQRAALERAALDPACHLPWTLLAAVGKVESDHADSGRLTPDGTALTPVLGPELNGQGIAALPDPDASPPGSAWLRATGPLQLLPTTWKEWARSARPGTPPDPDNIFDAAATAAAYLCDEHRDLTDPQQLSRAVLAYNPSAEYLYNVLSWVVAYSSANARLGADDGWFSSVLDAAERKGKSSAPAASPGPEAKPPEATTAAAAPLAPPPSPAPSVPSPRPEPTPGPPTSSPPPAPTATPAPAVPPARPSAQPTPTSPSPSSSPTPTAKPPTPGQDNPPAPSPTTAPVPSSPAEAR